METKITATEAARRFSDLLNRVQYRSESFVVERNGQVVCRISPEPLRTGTIADLFRIIQQHSPLDKSFANDLEEATRLHNQPASLDDPWSR
jgi:sulfur carrier protein ThiS